VNETTLQAQSDWLERRLSELGYSGHDFVAPNSGSRRTPEKRALLRKLIELRQRSEDALKFTAVF
jgi:hypothetical protein